MGSENKVGGSLEGGCGNEPIPRLDEVCQPLVACDDALRPAGKRFQERRAAIVAAAIPLLNDHGFKGMRLVEVGDQIGLKSTGITYYFPRKEDLALACIEHGIEVFHGFLSEAEEEGKAAARIRRLVLEFIRRDVLVRTAETTPLASFAAVRSLEGAHRERATRLYRDMFDRTRRLLDEDSTSPIVRQRSALHTVILLEQLYWASDWLSHYDIEEAPRLAERMADLMLFGLRVDGGGVEAGLGEDVCDSPPANEDFMRAATREINDHGYRGASIDRISASINLTKGAFYHHHDAKDELVRACFQRTFDLIRAAQRAARKIGSSEWERLSIAVNMLIRFQLSDDGPLLRTSALPSLPRDLQAEIRELSYRTGRTFSSMVSDGIAEGSIRPVDSTIAAHMLAAGINAAADVSNWPEVEGADVAVDYARALLCGCLNG